MDDQKTMPEADFRSDNTGRVAPELLEALVRANSGTAFGYGADEWTARLQRRFSELFETAVAVYPVATGTAANALALAALSPSFGAVYTLDEVRAIAAIAKAHGLKMHMDGARFANALVRLGCSPAELTWRSGVDVLSFGVTKNGGLLGDAIVVFNPAAVTALPNQLRRAGLVWSKMRFAAAQLLAYVEDELWLRMAAAANALAQRLAAGLSRIPGVELLAPVEANELFLRLPGPVIDGLERDGIRFYRRPGNIVRLVCRFDATAAEADAVIASLRRQLGG